MSSSKTQRSEFFMSANLTEPVILTGIEGRDYLKLRFKTAAADLFIGALVDIEADDLDEVALAADDGGINGIIMNTAYNRRQMQIDNSGDWTWTSTFDTGTTIDVAILINNVVARVKVAANSALTPDDYLETQGAGDVGLQAASGVAIGKPLAIVSSGTGVQYIAAILFAAQTGALHA